MVGARGFEPPTPWSRTRCSTRLSHAPTAWRSDRTYKPEPSYQINIARALRLGAGSSNQFRCIGIAGLLSCKLGPLLTQRYNKQREGLLWPLRRANCGR